MKTARISGLVLALCIAVVGGQIELLGISNEEEESSGDLPPVIESAPTPPPPQGSDGYMPVTMCGSTSVGISVDVTQLDADIHTDTMYVGPDHNDASCTPKVVGNLRVFTFGVEDCQPEKIEDPMNATFTYRYTIHGKESLVNSGSVSRLHNVALRVSCVYGRDGAINSEYAGKLATEEFVSESEGNFNFTMRMFANNNLTEQLSRGVMLDVGSPVFTEITMQSGINLAMFVQRCYASNALRNSTMTYDLIAEGGCIGDDETFEIITSSVTSKKFVFKFETFKFVGTADDSEMFLTCDLFLCQDNAPAEGKCVQPRECTAAISRRSMMQDYLISFGPIIVK